MILSDPIVDSTGGTGLIEATDFLVGTDRASYPLVQIKRNINRWYYRVQQIILGYMKGWVFKNEFGTHNFPTNSRTTGITIATDILSIDEVYVNYTVSNTDDWVKARFIDARKIPHPPVRGSDIYGQTAPRYWFKDRLTMAIDPQPSSQQTNGVKIRKSDAITELSAVGDEPIFYEGCHQILAAGAALDYAVAKKPDKIPELTQYLNRIIEGDGGLKDVYTKRLRDEDARIIPQVRQII